MSDEPVQILLATFNGARFLDAQLQSIFGQSDPNWRLLVRDDGSEDRTPALLDAAANRDRRIQIITAPTRRLGSTRSFFELMRVAHGHNARYFALCDQDDVWHPDKLSELRCAIDEAEAETGNSAPVLVCSDLAWIDADGGLVAPSHFDRAGAREGLAQDYRWILAMNALPGCAMMGNRVLLDAALQSTTRVAHHDWWLALIAGSMGQLRIVDRALVSYRQHAGNAIGAAGLAARGMQALIAPGAMIDKGRQTYWQSVDNAVEILERFAPESFRPGWASAIRHTALELGSSSRLRRAWAVLQGPVRRLGWSRNVLMLLSALGTPMPLTTVPATVPPRTDRTARMGDEPPNRQ